MLKILGTRLLGRLTAVNGTAGGSPQAAKAELSVAIVSRDDARAVFYPYVFVDNEGSVRELHRYEKQFLETPFAASDARRPYVKATYEQRNESRNLRGYCRRSALPKRLKIGYPPIEDPALQCNSRNAIVGVP